MLRLVHPAKPQGQEKRACYKPRSTALYPTPEETDRIRAAIRHLKTTYGGVGALGTAMGIRPKLLDEVLYRKSPGSYGLAVLLARAARVPVEQILSPGVTEVRRCPLCGRKGGTP